MDKDFKETEVLFTTYNSQPTYVSWQLALDGVSLSYIFFIDLTATRCQAT